MRAYGDQETRIGGSVAVMWLSFNESEQESNFKQ